MKRQIPNGYREIARLKGIRLRIPGVLILIATAFLLLKTIILKFLGELSSDITSIEIAIIALLRLVVAVLVYGIVHEIIHAVFLYIFSHERPIFLGKNERILSWLLRPYVKLASGSYVYRNEAIIAVLGPCLTITFMGIVLWLAVPTSVVPVVLFLLVGNVIASVSDILQSYQLLHFNNTVIVVGNESKDTVIYGPDEGNQSS